MDKEEHYHKLEAMYLSAPSNLPFDPAIRIEEGRAEVSIAIGPELHHAAGAVHGYVYFKAADDAAFFAVNSLVEDVFVLTTSLNLYLTRPVTEGVITGRAKAIFSSKDLFHAESILTDSEDREIGRATASFVKSRILLIDVVGYRRAVQ